MDRYRILLVTSSLGIGGAEHHILNLCRTIRSAGHEAAVWTISAFEDGLESTLVHEGIPLFRVPLRSLAELPSTRTVLGMRRILGSFQPHLLHAHLFHAEVAAACASLFLRVPLMVTRHSAGLEFRGWRRSVARLLEVRVAGCVAVSEEAAREAAAMGYPKRKITVLANAVDPQKFFPMDEPEREKRRQALSAELFPGAPASPFILIGSAGGLKPVKNFPLMVRVAARLAAANKRDTAEQGLRFVIFGEGAERAALAALARGLGIETSFALPGRREDLAKICALFDIFMLPSLSEGVPLALLEAMSSGVACVASNVGGVGEVLSDAGVLVSPGDEESALQAVQYLVDNKDTRREIGRKARVRVLERFHIDIWTDKMLSIYRSVINKGTSA
jgi:glycosyltransferase involved in cell wall biosynthesis